MTSSFTVPIHRGTSNRHVGHQLDSNVLTFIMWSTCTSPPASIWDQIINKYLPLWQHLVTKRLHICPAPLQVSRDRLYWATWYH